jgi:glycosyltransferase involved in cell wall biosynthesis
MDHKLNRTASRLPRTLIVWGWLPCNNSGAGILMRRLFADFPSDRLWALTSRQSARTLASHDPIPPAERQVPVPEIQIHRRWIDKFGRLFNRMLIPWTVWRGIRLVRKEQIEAIFTVPWDHFTIAAYFIHAITGIPIFMFVMDDPAGARRPGESQPLLYRMLMPRLVRACKHLWGVSDGMCEHFAHTYKVKCWPLLPLLDLERFQGKGARRADRSNVLFHIVFTGSIYSAQVDAVSRLVQVVNQHSGENESQNFDIRLTLYTPAAAGVLERMGLVGKNVRHDAVKHEDVADVLAEADVAFLPLSFEPNMRHVVETSFPSKIAEYLAAGVPILVHAPSYSTVARYCREYGCGLVVDEPNETSLREAVVRLATNPVLRQELSTRALNIAREKHDARSIAPLFLAELKRHSAI